MGWIISVEKNSSREEKWQKDRGSFNFRIKSKYGELISGLYCMWSNTSHLQLLGKLVTTFPRSGHTLLCKMSGPSPSKSSLLLCICCTQLWQYTLLSHFSTCNFINKNHHLLDLRLLLSKLFLVAGRTDFTTRLTGDFQTPVESL